MMKTKVFLAIALLLSFASVSRSQELVAPRKDGITIGDTKISREKNEIIIDYNVLMGDQVLSCKVDVTMLLNGKPFRGKEYFSGDIGNIRKPGPKQIRYDISQQKEELAGKDISFKINVLDKDVLDTKTILMATASPLSPRSYGLMAGVVKKVGGYARFHSNFSFTKTAFKADESGAIDGGGYMWMTGEGKVQTLRGTAGVLLRAHKLIYPYIGAGYGYNNYIYEDISGDWGLIKHLSSSGLVLETGIVVKAGPIALSAGVSSTMFKTASLDIGVGVIF